MGAAQSMVVNKTHKKICVLTFNEADRLYTAYNKMYVLEPGESKQVEALSSPLGLKIGIVYDAAPDGQVLMYQRWAVSNESVLTITSINGADIATYGGNNHINVWNVYAIYSTQLYCLCLLYIMDFAELSLS